MDTCAEGVETHDDLHLIRELGVSQVQGYIFGKPRRRRRSARACRQATRRGRRLSVHPRAPPAADAPRDGLDRRRGRCEVRLRNISAMGALVECDQPGRAGHPRSRWTSSASARSRAWSAGRRPASSGSSSPTRSDVAGWRRRSRSSTTSRCSGPGTSAEEGRELERLFGQLHHASAPASTCCAKDAGQRQLALGEEARGDQLGLVEVAIARAVGGQRAGDLHHLQPHPAERSTRPISSM